MAEHQLMADSVAAYVMGGLEPEEEEAVRRHLRGCPDCAALERRLRGTMALLPFAVEERTAPPRLRGRILSRLAMERSSRRHLSFRLQRPSLIAVLAAAVLLAAWSGFLTVRVQQLQQAQARSYPILAIGAQGADGAEGQVVVMPGQEVALVELQHLPSPPPGRVYEIWVGASLEDVRGAGVFLPDAAGSRLLVLSHDLSDARLLAITVEPGPDGSPRPTEPPRLIAHLA
ncbi:MAG TPA: anti-sigma factor [Candidatus Dormibacteraeota bacterium]|jgi:anti-sigma-K factor RskA|nr:anti-sigma factor [Candidatus Dormibacteraeota bacterium]